MTNKYLVEFGACSVEEWNSSFACNGACEKSLARSWRSNEQNTLRQLSTQIAKLLGVLQKLNDLLQLLLGFVTTLHIVKRHRNIFWVNFNILSELNSVTKIIS